MSAGDRVVYDSARRPPAVLGELRTVWEGRGLLRLLVRRDVVLRSQRSLLGLWWTLLYPLLTMAVLWLVFSNLIGVETGIPYAVHLLSGLVLYTLFEQVVLGVAQAMLANAHVLSKIHVPPALVCVSAGLAAAVDFAVSLVPLVVLTLAAGVAFAPTVPLVVVPSLLVLALAVGLGLLLAPLVVRFQDALQLVRVALLLGLYASPVLWPPSILDGAAADLLQANPLWHGLEAFRATLYEGTLGPWTAYAVLGGAAALALGAGLATFGRAWRSTVVLL